MSEQFKRIYKDLLAEDLTKVPVRNTVWGVEILFPEVHIELTSVFLVLTEVKIKLPFGEPQTGKHGISIPSHYITKFTFTVFGRKLYKRVRKILLDKVLKEEKDAISKTLEILEK